MSIVRTFTVTRAPRRWQALKAIPQPGDRFPYDASFIAQKPSRIRRIGPARWLIDVPYEFFSGKSRKMKKRHAILIAAVVFAWFMAFALMAFGGPTTAPASQPAKPVAIFITGLYDAHDASKGGNLNDYIKNYWRQKYHLELAMTVYDRDDEITALLPQSGTVILVGHSWGGDKILAVAKANPKLTFKLVFIDPVPRLNQKFDLPDNVVWAWDTYRTTRSDGKTPITLYKSAPINSGKWPFKNTVYVPKPGAGPDPQASEHGEKVWDGSAAEAVQQALK